MRIWTLVLTEREVGSGLRVTNNPREIKTDRLCKLCSAYKWNSAKQSPNAKCSNSLSIILPERVKQKKYVLWCIIPNPAEIYSFFIQSQRVDATTTHSVSFSLIYINYHIPLYNENKFNVSILKVSHHMLVHSQYLFSITIWKYYNNFSRSFWKIHTVVPNQKSKTLFPF